MTSPHCYHCQLEGEMEREGWSLSEINLDLIFEMDNTEKWLNAIKKH